MSKTTVTLRKLQDMRTRSLKTFESSQVVEMVFVECVCESACLTDSMRKFLCKSMETLESPFDRFTTALRQLDIMYGVTFFGSKSFLNGRFLSLTDAEQTVVMNCLRQRSARIIDTEDIVSDLVDKGTLFRSDVEMFLRDSDSLQDVLLQMQSLLHSSAELRFRSCTLRISLSLSKDAENIRRWTDFVNRQSVHFDSSLETSTFCDGGLTVSIRFKLRLFDFVLEALSLHQKVYTTPRLDVFPSLMDTIFWVPFEHTVVINLMRRPDRAERWMRTNTRPSLIQFQWKRAVDPVFCTKDAMAYDAYLERYMNHSTSKKKSPVLPFGFNVDDRWLPLSECPMSLQRLGRTRFGPRLLADGEYGIYQSVVQVLNDSLAKNVPFTTIFEDDACFHRQFEEKWKQLFPRLPSDWNVLFLGAKTYGPLLSEHCRTETHVCKLNVYHTGFHAVILRKEAMRIIAPFAEKNSFLPIDELMKPLCALFPADLHMYVLDDPLVITLCDQNSGSDIQTAEKHIDDSYELFHWQVDNFHL